MRILQVLLSPRIGGAEALAESLDQAWSFNGTACRTHYLDPDSNHPKSRLKRLFFLAQAVQEWKPDVVVSHSALPNMYARLVAGNRVPVITVLHSATDDFEDRLLRWAERILRRRTAAVVAVSENQGGAYLARFGRTVPMQVIPNGIRRDAHQKGVYQDRPTTVSTLARVATQKNPYLWSEVARLMGHTGPDIDLEWWGPSNVDIDVDDVFSTTRLAGGRGKYMGPSHDPISVLTSSDLLFHSADREAHSIGILEAATVGLPVVCSDSVASTLPADVVAVSFKDGDSHSAVEALRLVIDTWPALAQQAMDAAPLVAKKFSIDHCATTYMSLFEKSLEKPLKKKQFGARLGWRAAPGLAWLAPLGKGLPVQQDVDNNACSPNVVPSISVLWVTNLAAPYRRPVWRELARRHELTVALLESDKGLARDRDSNRGQDWLHASDEHLTFKELRTWKYSHGESRYYFLKSLPSALSVRKYDVVLFGGWESPAYWLLLLGCVISGTARVGFYESPQNTMTHKLGPIAALRSLFFRSMTCVIVPGDAAYDALRGIGVPTNRIHKGFNAVDVTTFHKAAHAASDDNADAGRTGHRYLYVGQLINRKRVKEIVQAFTEAAEPEDELAIVGTGDAYAELTNLVEASHAKVSFLGQVNNSDLPSLMATQNTLILASNREVWGLVVNEALASGMHVVVTENCGVSQSVNGMRGVYVANENLDDLAQKIQLSRTAWAGRIAAPEILEYTPSRFAAVFDEAFVAAHLAVTTGRNRRLGVL